MTPIKLLTALVRRRYSCVDMFAATAIAVWVGRSGSIAAGAFLLFLFIALSDAAARTIERRDR